MDRNHFDEIISSMLKMQLIYDKPPKKGPSYYIMEQMNDDIDDNTNNTNDDQIKSIDNSQNLTINTSDNDENSTEQSSRETVIKEDFNTPTGLQDRRGTYNILKIIYRFTEQKGYL